MEKIFKIAEWVGIIAQAAALYLVFFGSGNSDMFLLIISLLFSLSYPISKFLNSEAENYRNGLYSAIGAAIVIIILGLIFKDSGNFIDTFFYEICKPGFLILYLILLALADYYAPKGQDWAVGLVIGALLPLMLLFIIAIVILVALGASGSRAGPRSISSLTSSSQSSNRGENRGGDGFGRGLSYYCIWTDGNTVISKMPNDFHFQCDHDPSYGEVERYLKRQGWRSCHVLMVKRSGSNDSVLNYLNDLKATYGDRPL